MTYRHLILILSLVWLAAACGQTEADSEETNNAMPPAMSGDTSNNAQNTGGMDTSAANNTTPPMQTGAANNDDNTTSCTADCSATECGPDPVCGESCGSCSGQDTCMDGACMCQPDCDGKTCGPDGCGGVCGTCQGQDACVDDQCICQPNCDGKTCGSDGCGGVCGMCQGQDACVDNQCVCQPDCGADKCGADGCGGMCDPCSLGLCENRQCVIQCQPNETRCVASDVQQQEACVDGVWQVQSCPNYNVCIEGGCAPVCDGALAATTDPAACFFPTSAGPLVFTNDPKLPTANVSGAVYNLRTNGLANTLSVTGTAWPLAWDMYGTLSVADTALANYYLTNFSYPVQEVTLRFRARRTGLIHNDTAMRYSVAFFNTANIVFSQFITARYAWTTHTSTILINTTQSLSRTGENTIGLSLAGDGFAGMNDGLNHGPDNVQLSWFMVEIKD